MKGQTINKTAATVMFVLTTALGISASPLTPIAKAGTHIGGKAAVRGGTALAAATAKRGAMKSAARKTTGKMARGLTPGMVLATGGAAALTVGAHEMADGVQSVGESIGDAVRGNPDIARSVVHELFTLPKPIIALASVAGVAFLAWFFWPIITLVRTLVRLVCAPKRSAIAGVAANPAAQSGRLSTASNGAAGFTRAGVALAVAGMVVLTSLGVWLYAKMRETTPQETETMPAVHTCKTNEALRTEHKAEVERIYRAFLAEVDSAVVKGFECARADIPNVVEKFGSSRHCLSLLKAMVSDKLFDENEVDNIINQDLTPFYDKLYAARDAVASCVHRLATNLAENDRAFARKLNMELVAAEANGDEEYRERLEQWGERIDKRLSDLRSGQQVAGVAVVFEAVCVRETAAAIAKLLGGIATRQAGTMAASAGATVVDGPLPFGDMVGGFATVVCTLWSIYDVYQAAEVLPGKLAETLRSAADDCERQCREEARRLGRNLVSELR